MNDVWEDDVETSTSCQNQSFMRNLALNSVINRHFNQGYLEGLTEAKKVYTSLGFNENYGKCAFIGVKAGRLLGLLEGLQFYFEKQGETRENLENLKRWIKKVEKQLEINKVFSEEYLESNGLLKYDNHPVLEKIESEISNYLENINFHGSINLFNEQK